MVLRELASQVAYPLCIIFKKSLGESELPACWKLGHITPIFKKGSKTKASNYRLVSLTSVVCKTLEHLVRADIVRHAVDVIYLAFKRLLTQYHTNAES